MEPTRDEIKKAFQDSIARWERIVEDVDYYKGTDCALCNLGDAHNSCNNDCPIVEYSGERVCVGTPFNDYHTDKTPENALAELNYLRKVYIWWIERGKKDKPQEWVDVTESFHLLFHKHGSGGYDIHFSSKDDTEDWIGWIYSDGRIELSSEYEDEYKVEVVDDETFKILKRSKE